ncbi:TetR/AcrR family transcriptional regulator [Archangium sp.]|uniref:TetR/AcrR family transcriptional regulator n=1 Tax=Archangium sp. TaxID=1872627 RepID=UPI002D5E3537|nr:TetR/AcrR family transcriptional regulator [Archangium sp.]HYO52469.1 TetR/AcrR family transcriptional regulator [Archangium sp.]
MAQSHVDTEVVPSDRTPPKGTRSTNTRAHILDAAEEFVLEHGGRELTLEQVAKAAGLSKGGVLYHFPTKTALLQTMLARLLDYVEAEFQAGVGDTTPQDRLMAYTHVSLHANEKDKRLGAALLAVLAEDPKLLEPLRTFYRKRFAELRSLGPHFGRATVILLAVEGLFMLELLGLSDLSSQERGTLEWALRALVDAEAPGGNDA